MSELGGVSAEDKHYTNSKVHIFQTVDWGVLVAVIPAINSLEQLN